MRDEGEGGERKRRKRRKRAVAAEASARADEVQEAAATTRDLRAAKRLVKLSAALLLAGVALTATGETALGPLVDAAGLLAGVLAAHRLGRTGQDEGPIPEGEA